MHGVIRDERAVWKSAGANPRTRRARHVVGDESTPGGAGTPRKRSRGAMALTQSRRSSIRFRLTRQRWPRTL